MATNSQLSKKFHSVKSELKRWKRKSDCSSLKLNREDDATLYFTINDIDFNVNLPFNYPDHRTGSFCAEFKDDELNWMGYDNIFANVNNPSLSRFLLHIEESYKKHSCGTEVALEDIDEDGFYKDEETIDTFDIDISRMRRELDSNMDKCTGGFSIEGKDRKAPQLFKGSVPGNIILNELMQLLVKYRDDEKVEITPVDNNVYHWNVKFRAFDNESLRAAMVSLKTRYDYDYIEFDVYFHEQYYPTYPPLIKYKRPRLNKCMMHRLSNLKMVNSDYWSPTRGMSFVISKMYTVLSKNADVNIGSEMNDSSKHTMGAYLDLESHLMRLAAYCDDSTAFASLDEQNYDRVYGKDIANQASAASSKSKHWASGTGYGTSGSSNWNVSQYIELQKQKDTEVESILENIIVCIQSHPYDDMLTIYNTIDGSYLISYITTVLDGGTVLEMRKRKNIYRWVFSVLQTLATEEGMFLFDGIDDRKGLFDILSEQAENASQIIKLAKMGGDTDIDDEDDMAPIIVNIHEMIKPCFDAYIEMRQKIEGDKKSNFKQKIEVDMGNKEHRDYETVLSKMSYGTANIVGNNYNYESALNTALPKKTLKRIAAEYGNLMKSLPTYFCASIFFRIDNKDIRVCRAMITGPDGTPYDSGIYIFDIKLPDDYPNKAPSVTIRNNGGKRFNPNLYEGGKVCLSLLGTWSGTGGEKWIPEQSTILQVLNSIQSLILIDEPYYNEPGWERYRGTPEGINKVKTYNNSIRLYTMTHSMNDAMERPSDYGGFEDAVTEHFKRKKDYILQTCGKWVDEASYESKDSYKKQFDRLKVNLENLK